MSVVASVPRFGGCHAQHQEKDGELNLRRSDGHPEIPPEGATLVLMLCDPLGRAHQLGSW